MGISRREQDLRRIKALRYMDDDFMKVCLNGNIKGTEFIIRIILGDSNIRVRSVSTQDEIKNLFGHSVILDIHAVGSDGVEFDVEIQRADRGAVARRARYHSSLLDSRLLKAGEEYDSLKDTYVIFITEHDVLKEGKALYRIDRHYMVDGVMKPFNDGSHIIYVNGEYRGEDEIGKLIHDFSCTNPDEMYNEDLAERARYFKEDEEGVKSMCKMLEDMCREASLETARETAEKMLQDGMSLDKVSRYTKLTMEEIKKIENEIQQLIET